MMVRLLTAFILILTLVFTGIGLLLARAWGWSEYASNELYVLYTQVTNGTSSEFYLVNTDGSDQRWKLATQAGTLTTLSCSPDGRKLAFLTDKGRLSVVDQAGVVYERTLGAGYDSINAANNGTVAVSKTQYGIGLIVNAQNTAIPVPPDHVAYDPIKIASSGVTLWSHTAQGGIKLLSPSGDTMLTVAPNASSPSWLAGEQMFTYADASGAMPMGGVVDTSRKVVAQVYNSLLPFGLLSPDASVEVLRYVPTRQSHEQLYLVDPLTSQPKQQLTNDDNFHLPVCFLTFRPPMLIGQEAN